VDIAIQGPQGDRILRLHNVALCENFACNLVSLRQLHKQGYWSDNRPGFNHLRQETIPRALYWNLTTISLSSNTFPKIYHVPRSTFHARRNKFNSWSKKRVTSHPGPQALEHLVQCSQGARIRGPTVVSILPPYEGKTTNTPRSRRYL